MLFPPKTNVESSSIGPMKRRAQWEEIFYGGAFLFLSTFYLWNIYFRCIHMKVWKKYVVKTQVYEKELNAISERIILLWKRRPVDNFTSIHFPFNKIRQTHSKQQLMTILQKISNVFFLDRSIETEEIWFFIWYYRNIYLRNKFTYEGIHLNAMQWSQRYVS